MSSPPSQTDGRRSPQPTLSRRDFLWQTTVATGGLILGGWIAGGPAAAQTPPPPLALINTTLFDGTGATPVADAAVVVAEGRILAAGPRAKVNLQPISPASTWMAALFCPALSTPTFMPVTANRLWKHGLAGG